jgi:hypothetical protein
MSRTVENDLLAYDGWISAISAAPETICDNHDLPVGSAVARDKMTAGSRRNTEGLKKNLSPTRSPSNTAALAIVHHSCPGVLKSRRIIFKKPSSPEAR